MKMKITALLGGLTMLFALSTTAFAQTELTDDVVFVKLGYTKTTVSYDGDVDDSDFGGLGVQGEYNINMNPMLVGIGIEYQYVTGDYDSTMQFLNPMVTAKFMTAGGFYAGAGLVGRYMLSFDDENDSEIDKKIDLWGQVTLGFMMPIDEGIYFDVEGKFGYNFTNNQFEETNSYDLSVYAGIGFRAFSTGL